MAKKLEIETSQKFELLQTFVQKFKIKTSREFELLQVLELNVVAPGALLWNLDLNPRS